MAIIIDLPPEILEQIYHYLGSIDDVHHFGRMCSRTHHVIQKQNIYLEIMRSIIHSSPQHRYDFQLCRSLDLHRKIVAHLERHPTPFAASQPGVFSFSIWETQLMQTARGCSSPAEWTDDMICDILARYQGLRVLENIWLERELQEQAFLSVEDTSDAQRFVHRFATLVDREQKFRDGDLPRRNPNTPHTWYYTELNADQRERFYAAITCVWLLNEIRWVLTNFAYPANFTVQIEILGALKARIEWETRTPLLDELDRHAVFTFMYHHLIPLHALFMADASSSKLPFTFASDFSKDTAHCTRLLQLFLMASQTYFQPPDLIDLMLRSRTSRKPPYPLLLTPCSTEKYRRPLPSLFYPGHDLNCTHLKPSFQRTSIAHLTLITRSSFHQTSHDMSQGGISPSALGEALFKVPDHARRYLADRVLVAFEKDEVRERGKREIRGVWGKKWSIVGWAVWWWAGSEEKARMKMERLRTIEQ
ncbi:hypothetical protein GT037_004976 [Alternaria burnsii]|uniref:F-box domain-containing protein n=1 Tax=Alternaria burnsii TaxID=1187904 RepID=A0A8H7EFJ7_9PLEO|nr:uncharacterized protein GT037_004976 [Alternaria burnsii]KAF7676764.1 hypothetical protein GT037_004976 [Alternaria burnsii]